MASASIGAALWHDLECGSYEADLHACGPGRQSGPPDHGAGLDARSFVLGRRFALAIAPMQLMQLSAAPRPGAALADPFDGFEPDSRPSSPPRRDHDECALSSTRIALRTGERRVEIDLHRRAVSPSGRLSEKVLTIRLDRVEPDALAREGAAAGFRPVPPATSQKRATTWAAPSSCCRHRSEVSSAVVTRRGDVQSEDIGTC